MNVVLEGKNINPVDLIGKKVYLQHENAKEYGVIVNAWIDGYLDAIDCHVAFYPDGNTYGYTFEQSDKPYILRYLYRSLTLMV